MNKVTEFNQDVTPRESSMHFIEDGEGGNHVRLKIDGIWLDTKEGADLLKDVMENNPSDGVAMMMTMAMMLSQMPGAEIQEGEYTED